MLFYEGVVAVRIIAFGWKCNSLSEISRSPRNQESGTRNQDNSRKTVIVEDTSSKAMMAIDGVGFDWSYMVDDEVSTNMALMAFSDSENEVVFCDQIAVLKRDASFRDSEITALNLQIEKLKKEKESNHIKIDNFKNASKSLDKLIGSQITDNSKTRLGFTSYNAIAPPPIDLIAPSTIDLSNSGLEEFKQHEFEGYGPKAILTKSGIVPVSAARQSSSREAAPASAAMPINTADSVNTAKGNKVTSAVGNEGINVVKSSACWVWRPKIKVQDHVSKNSRSYICKHFDYGAPQDAFKDQGYFDSGCSRHMTRNISYLTDFKEHDGGYVAFRRGAKGGKITGKCTIKTADESQVLLKVPRKNNMYSFDMTNIVPQKDLTCLLVKATNDESMLWKRRVSHINFKNINKLVKDNLVRGLPQNVLKMTKPVLPV
nr:ribonuclease H-like domain-containing protein [Tanacetum cinerariifolium]